MTTNQNNIPEPTSLTAVVVGKRAAIAAADAKRAELEGQA